MPLQEARAQGGGRILQVSSAGGQTTYPNFSYYHASKWGIEGFADTVAQEVAPLGIGVTIVELGASPVLSGLAKRIDRSLGRRTVSTPADLEAVTA